MLVILSCTVCAFAAVESDDTNKVMPSVSFSSDIAYCSVKITSASDTTSITDCTMTLTDSYGNVIRSWSGLSSTGSSLTVSKITSGVSKGETYTLSVSATVHRNGSAEPVSGSYTAKYQ